jgi:hypothetical protein
MNRTSHLFALICGAGLLLVSCQPHTKPAVAARAQSAAVSSEPPTKADAPDGVPTGQSSAAAEAAPPTPDMAKFLAANNLAPLWQSDFGKHEDGGESWTTLDGFYGAEHRHISFIFERVVQDARQPNVFRVQGRSRYKKTITPFDGTITLANMKRLPVYLDLDSVEEAHARAYTASGPFVLREDPAAAGAGTFQGTVYIDFYQLASGQLHIVQGNADKSIPAGGAGLVFRGQWQSQRTGRQNAVAFSTYPQAVLPDAMADFYLGDRQESINPKYARLDWAEAWENEEWWAKSPKPSLNL